MTKTQPIIDNDLVRRLNALYKHQRERSSNNIPKEAKGFDRIYSLARRAMGEVISEFLEDYAHNRVGNWIAGQPLALQLLSQPRLTVDLTVDQLKDSRPYGLRFETFVRAAEAGCFYLNIRDFDSEKQKGFCNLAAGIVGDRLTELLEAVGRRVYIGSAVREGIFDLVAGGETTLQASFAKAQKELAFGPNVIQPKHLQKDFFFRGEQPSLVAVSFHKAYLSCVKKELTPEEWTKIEKKYDDAVRSGQKYLQKSNSNTQRDDAATKWLELARTLRLNHLQFTAPITASWGSSYNLTKKEFLDSCCTMADPLGVSDPEIQKWILVLIENRDRGYDDWDLLPSENIQNISDSVMERAIDYVSEDDNDQTLQELRKAYCELIEDFVASRKDPFEDTKYSTVAKEFKAYMRSKKIERSKKMRSALGSAFLPLAVLDAGFLAAAGVGILGLFGHVIERVLALSCVRLSFLKSQRSL